MLEKESRSNDPRVDAEKDPLKDLENISLLTMPAERDPRAELERLSLLRSSAEEPREAAERRLM